MRQIFKIVFLTLALCVVNCALFTLSAQPKREWRSAWITTVWAIDWPTSWGTAASLSGATKQQDELRALIDSLATANMNACCFQVRSFCDAMYRSNYEPWSKYLCGTRGVEPLYDPLQLLVDYAHQKGIEVHVWMNPYRYSTSTDTHGTLPNDYATVHPEWLVNCGGTTILNPCLAEVKERIAAVTADVVRNYDIDGVIFDDYFYQSGYSNSFDDTPYYQATGNGMTKNDWRRAQVNEMVRMVRDSIKSIKPWVTFGIGPAGVAGCSESANKHGVEPTPVGSDWQYNGIYSDPLAWYEEGTIDYMAPQLYWVIGHATNDYAQLCEWWSKMACHFGRHVYPSPSLSTMKAENASLGTNECHRDGIAAELQLNREYDRMGASGCNIYSISTGMKQKGFFTYIRNHANQHPAVVPQMTWYRTDACKKVSSVTRSGNLLRWTAPESNLRYAVYAVPTDSIGQPGIFGSSRYLIGTTYSTSMILPADVQGTLAVAVLDRFGNEFPVRTLGNTAWGTSVAAQLTYPTDSDAVLLPCTFSWTPAAGADSYFFQLSKSADFSTVDYEYETLAPEFFVGKVEWIRQDTPYYWRVRTRSANANDTYSEVRSFTGNYFHMIAPQNDTRDCALTLSLVCDSVATSSVQYTFEIASESSFAAGRVVYTGVSNSPRHQVAADALENSKYYFARCKADYAGITVVSDVVRFRTEAQEVPVPTIVSPADGDTIYATEVTVTWAEQASGGFQVEMSTATSFAPRLTKKSALLPKDQFSYLYSDVEPGTYYIRVKASGDSGYTQPSEVVSVTVQEPTALDYTGSSSRVVKQLENGVIVIMVDGVKYNVLGQKTE